MNTENPEVQSGGEPVLRREARTAMSSRVPLALSIAVALLSGVLAGYGVRAFTAGDELRPSTCPRRHGGTRVLIPPRASDAAEAKMQLLKDCVRKDASLEEPSKEQAAVRSKLPAAVRSKLDAAKPAGAKAPAVKPEPTAKRPASPDPAKP